MYMRKSIIQKNGGEAAWLSAKSPPAPPPSTTATTASPNTTAPLPPTLPKASHPLPPSRIRFLAQRAAQQRNEAGPPIPRSPPRHPSPPHPRRQRTLPPHHTNPPPQVINHEPSPLSPAPASSLPRPPEPFQLPRPPESRPSSVRCLTCATAGILLEASQCAAHRSSGTTPASSSS